MGRRVMQNDNDDDGKWCRQLEEEEKMNCKNNWEDSLSFLGEKTVIKSTTMGKLELKLEESNKTFVMN